MIRRTVDPTFLNSVVNHPEVRPWMMAPPGELELAPLLENRDNFALETEGGGFLVLQAGEPGVYEVHTQFLPDFRGKHALSAVSEAMFWMFTRTDCMTLLTRVPIENVVADRFAKHCGFRFQFELERAWNDLPVRFFSQDYSDWFPRAPELIPKGEWFHDQLEAKGLPAEHSHSSAHNRAVGAAVAMLMAGQVAKGVLLYNRWARFAGYGTISVLQGSPLVINIGSAIVGITPKGFDLIEV